MASVVSHRPSKRARTSGSRTSAVGEDKGAQSSNLPNEKGKAVEKPFDFFRELPVDLLGEITGYLKPADLLHLSRTTRELRAFFMCTSSASFWKQARENDTDLPLCPDDLSEPAYAHLLFSSFCHKCLSDSKDLLLHLEARIQLCESCTLEEFKRWHELPGDVDIALSELVPDTIQQLTTKEKKQGWYKANAKYQKVARTRFHVATAMRLHEEYRKLRGTKKKGAWLAEQKKIQSAVEEHAVQCQGYIVRAKERERLQEELRKQQRADLIREKLTGLGWGNEFEEARSRRHPAMNTPDSAKMICIIYRERALTEEEWEEVQGGLIQWMEEIRENKARYEVFAKMRNRVETALGPAYTTFALSQPPGAMIPTLPELALMEEFAVVLNSVPLDNDMPAGVLDSAISQVPGLVQGWRALIDAALLDLLRRSPAFSNQANITTDVLSHASTTFSCTRCAQLLAYPSIFAHSCFSTSIASATGESMEPGARMAKGGAPVAGPSQGSVTEALVPATFGPTDLFTGRYRVWHPGPLLQLNEAAHHHTIAILDLLGMDRTTTMDTLLSLNPYVEGVCRCFPRTSLRQATSTRRAMRWTDAVVHCGRHRSGTYESSFNVFTDEVTKELPGYTANLPPISTKSRCFWCGSSVSSFLMEFHMIAKHGLSQAQAAAARQIAPHEVLYPVGLALRIGS